MYAKPKQIPAGRSRVSTNSVVQNKNKMGQLVEFVDNRPESITQRRLQTLADNYSGHQPIQRNGNGDGDKKPSTVPTGEILFKSLMQTLGAEVKNGAPPCPLDPVTGGPNLDAWGELVEKVVEHSINTIKKTTE